MTDIVHRLRDWRNLDLALSGELFDAAADEIERLRNGAVAGCETPTLTDAERNAIQKALKWALNLRDTGVTADSLRSILERLT